MVLLVITNQNGNSPSRAYDSFHVPAEMRQVSEPLLRTSEGFGVIMHKYTSLASFVDLGTGAFYDSVW